MVTGSTGEEQAGGNGSHEEETGTGTDLEDN